MLSESISLLFNGVADDASPSSGLDEPARRKRFGMFGEATSGDDDDGAGVTTS